MHKITPYFLLACICFSLTSVLAQKDSDWTSISQRTSFNTADISFRQDHMPTVYSLFALDHSSITKRLNSAPIRGKFFGTSKNVINIPTDNGELERFRVTDAHIMHDDLQKKFPNIRSYVGQSIDNPGNYIRFSHSDRKGFHAQIFEPGKETRYIDPYTKDKSVYISYSRKDLVNMSLGEFSCETDNAFQEPINGAYPSNTTKATDDGIIRVYELALSVAGEYSEFHSNVADDDATRLQDVMAEMVVAMTRVNGIYEKEMGITFELIANNDEIIFLDSATDPWDGEYNDKTQEVIDDIIGDENYDIGHNFNTSGGGNAGCIGCVCNTGNKGSGYTGLPSPQGDPFYVDFVAHEMGHQIGGYHTHNGTGTCLKSGNNTEVEPGSGSSIMGYAGICPGQDIQNQSDDYFNYVNIRDISANIQSGVSSTCFDAIPVSNQAPTASAGPDLTIPIGTAFRLIGVGSDPDTGDVLTYTWEQNDSEDMQTPLQPSPTATAGPMFRSRRGTTEPFRYFPQLSDILANDLMPRWEVIPMAQRDLEFAFTVRDNVVYGGQTQDDLKTISTTILAGPFTVSSQNSNTTWIQGDTETVSWDVAGTDFAPVNCTIVDIIFSASGDFSDSVILAKETSNDGSEDIIVPPTLTDAGRLMVRAADNVFLDVNDAVITVEEVADATFFLNIVDFSKEACANDSTESFTFNYTPTSTFTETVTFSATGIPDGSAVTFSPATVSDSETTVTMMLSNLDSAGSGDYTIAIEGSSSSVTKSEEVNLLLKGTNFETPSLAQPANNASDIATYPTYMWSEDTSNTAEFYDIEVASDAAFINVVETATTQSNSYTGQIGLEEVTTYYWRIRPGNSCETSSFTEGNAFTTGSSQCFNEENNTPTLILSTFTASSSITIDENIPLSDINISASITHPYIGDVVLELVSPAGTAVTVLASRCDSNPDLDATFDDDGTDLVCGSSSPSITGTLKPQQPLSAFNGESSEGTWTLNITDTGIGDDGTLDSWSIEYCGVQEQVLAVENFTKANIVMYPNPATNTLNIEFSDVSNIKANIYDLAGRQVLSKSLNSAQQSIDVSTLAAGAYLVQMTTQDNKSVTKRLIIE